MTQRPGRKIWRQSGGNVCHSARRKLYIPYITHDWVFGEWERALIFFILSALYVIKGKYSFARARSLLEKKAVFKWAWNIVTLPLPAILKENPHPTFFSIWSEETLPQLFKIKKKLSLIIPSVLNTLKIEYTFWNFCFCFHNAVNIKQTYKNFNICFKKLFFLSFQFNI